MEQKNGKVTIEVEEEPGNNIFLVCVSLCITIIALGGWWHFTKQLQNCQPEICKLVEFLANGAGGAAVIGFGFFLIGLCLTWPNRNRKRKQK